MNVKNTTSPIGLLDVKGGQDKFNHETYAPKSHLADIIEHYWFVQWSLPEGISHTQSVIPHPNTHVTWLNDRTQIQGISQQKYSHTLAGLGSVVGIKFKPAGFYPFACKARLALTELSDQTFPIERVFNIESETLKQNVLLLSSVQEKIDMIDEALFSFPFLVDENVRKVNHIFSDIAFDNTLMKVSDVCNKHHLDKRVLQRLFSKYVGVSVKWVIKRYRIHDALTAIESQAEIDWSQLAIDLGYYDQAHFITDFKKLVGQSPKQYLLSLKQSL